MKAGGYIYLSSALATILGESFHSEEREMGTSSATHTPNTHPGEVKHWVPGPGEVKHRAPILVK